MPVSWWDVYGSYLPESWEYQITLAGPDETYTMRVRGDRLLHARYACTPTEPWRGVSPLAHSRTTSDLAAMLEHRLSEEVTAPADQVLPVPASATDPQMNTLKASLRTLRGKLGLVPSMGGDWSGARQDAPRGDWETRRLGANPPASLDMLRSSSARHVLAACGVPVELVEASEGTGAREAFRRFLHATIAPAARLPPGKRRWTKREDDLIRQVMMGRVKPGTWARIAKETDRSAGAVKERAVTLRKRAPF